MAILQALHRAEVNPQADKGLVVSIVSGSGVREQGQTWHGRNARLVFKTEATETPDQLVVFATELESQIGRRVPLEVGAAVEAVVNVVAQLGADLPGKREPVGIKLARAADPEHVRVTALLSVRVPADPGARYPQSAPAWVAPEQMQPDAAFERAITPAEQAV